MDLQPIKLGFLDTPKDKWLAGPVQKLLEGAQKRPVEIQTLSPPKLATILQNFSTETELDALICDLEELPLKLPERICPGAYVPVASRTDILVLRSDLGTSSLENLPSGARIATRTARRRAQLLHLNSSLQVTVFEGSPASALDQVQKQDLEGFCVGGSDLEIFELGVSDDLTISPLPERYFHPGSGQGCIAALVHNKRENLKLMNKISHDELEVCMRFERELLEALNGGLSVPLGVFSEIVNGEFILNGILLSKNGDDYVTLSAATHHFDDPDFISNIICEVKVREKTHLLDEVSSNASQSSQA